MGRHPRPRVRIIVTFSVTPREKEVGRKMTKDVEMFR